MEVNGIYWDWDFTSNNSQNWGIGFVKLGWFYHGFFTDRSSFVE